MTQHTFITYSAMFGFWLAVFPWLGLCGGQGGPMMAFDDLSGGDSAPFGSILPFGVRANKRTCAKQSAKGFHFGFSNCTLGGISPTNFRTVYRPKTL
jgi:hypothetical protein